LPDGPDAPAPGGARADPDGLWDELAVLLSRRPRTAQALADALRIYGLRFTVFVPTAERPGRLAQVERARRHRRSPAWLSTHVATALDAMASAGWVSRDGPQYALTPIGHLQVERARERADARIAHRRWLLTADGAARLTLVTQIGLAALKLPAALVSGSVAQLNDAADTLLDLFSAVVVFIGIRLKRERAASVLLVVLMLATGAFTLWQAVERLLNPSSPTLELFPTAVAVGSVAVYLGLWFIQRLVGLRSASLALITQSVDSRNHIIVAVGVTAGLVTASLHLPLVDALVGLAVALVIGRAGIELALDVARSGADEEPDLSRYRFWIGEWTDAYQRRSIQDWLLYVVAHDGIESVPGLLTRAHEAIASEDGVFGTELGSTRIVVDDVLAASLGELRRRGWITGDGQLIVTATGRRHLRHWLGHDEPTSNRAAIPLVGPNDRYSE